MMELFYLTDRQERCLNISKTQSEAIDILRKWNAPSSNPWYRDRAPFSIHAVSVPIADYEAEKVRTDTIQNYSPMPF